MTISTERMAHPYHMHDAIIAQPEAISCVIVEERDNVRRLADLTRDSNRTHIVGIGTSWHALLVGERLLRTEGGMEDTRAWNSYEFCDRPPSLSANDVVIVLSHRGVKTYSASALELARRSGAKTGLLTGIGSDARREFADVVVETSEPDPSSAFTISHTAALTALMALSVELSGADSTAVLSDLPEALRDAISTEADVRDWAADSKSVERFYFLGSGPNESTAYEAALKMKEANYTTTEGFHLEQYLHGPFVSTDEGCLVTFIAPPNSSPHDRVIDLMKAVSEVGARSAAIIQAGDDARAALVGATIEMPESSDLFSPVIYLAPLQLFTYWLAIEIGHNPDVFRLNDPKHIAARRHYTL